jgi:hypothetical protein
MSHQPVVAITAAAVNVAIITVTDAAAIAAPRSVVAKK